MNDEAAIRAATAVLLEPVLRLLQDDPHMWSARGCQTCRAISSIVGRPFGCVAYAAKASAEPRRPA